MENSSVWTIFNFLSDLELKVTVEKFSFRQREVFHFRQNFVYTLFCSRMRLVWDGESIIKHRGGELAAPHLYDC